MKRRHVPLPSEEVQDRFWSKVAIPDDDASCWLWKAAPRGSDGLGVFGIAGTVYYAHRLAYVIAFGSIPDDKDVRRSCNNPLCVRPMHLVLADPQNMDSVDRKI